ncbi:uncharacterized protein [Coffea arabica]|uniref:Transcription repressor n=1 Tax=Coffea arabica TaxID=13443 RepID=A0A6P6SYF7_COFAR|nr:transcription repressor OFP3-like [Coffea arabica]
MGNYRFRLSDMMPNAWLYKLREMSKSRNQKMIRPTSKKQHQTSSSSSSLASSLSSNNIAAPGLSSQTAGPPQHPHLSSQRKSYYFTRDLCTPPPPPDDHDHAFYDQHDDHVTRSSPPRKSSRKKRTTTSRNRAISSSNDTTSPSPRPARSSVVPAECSCRATIPSVCTTEPDSTTPEEYPNPPPDCPSSDDQSLEFCSTRGTPAETTVQGMVSGSASCRCKSVENRAALLNQPELIKNVSEPCSAAKLGDFSIEVSEILDLPPIMTNKPPCSNISKEREEGDYEPSCRLRGSEYGSLSVKVAKDDILRSRSNNARPFKDHKKTGCPAPPAATVSVSSSSPGAGGLKLRTNSPRIANMRIQLQARKSLSSSPSSSSSRSRSRSRRRRRSVSESFAVVKSSKDPQSDFRESMMEMIVENNICASKDLEDLLACYLSLNSDQYHDLIIRVFKQIWFDIVGLHHPN